MRNNEAIEWLIAHRNIIFKTISHKDGDPNIKELLKSLDEITLKAIEADQTFTTMNSTRQIFVVSMEAPNALNTTIVFNYISKALKRFYSKDNVGWFDGVTPPSFFITPVPLLEEKDATLRALVSDIKFSRDILNSFYDRVERQ